MSKVIKKSTKSGISKMASAPTVETSITDETARKLSHRVSNHIDLLRAHLVDAQVILKEAREQAKQSKQRRKLARLLEKRARKDMKRAKENLIKATSAVQQAEAFAASNLNRQGVKTSLPRRGHALRAVKPVKKTASSGRARPKLKSTSMKPPVTAKPVTRTRAKTGLSSTKPPAIKRTTKRQPVRGPGLKPVVKPQSDPISKVALKGGRKKQATRSTSANTQSGLKQKKKRTKKMAAQIPPPKIQAEFRNALSTTKVADVYSKSDTEVIKVLKKILTEVEL